MDALSLRRLYFAFTITYHYLFPQLIRGDFLLGVIIPIEVQFGTNWSEFPRRTGGVIGMPLAMKGTGANAKLIAL